MGRKRAADTHLPAHLYVRHGKHEDRYYTRLGGQYRNLGPDRRAAERELRDLLAGRPVAGTIGDLAAKFIEHQRALLARGDKHALAPRTIDDYENDLAQQIVPVFGRMRPEDFRPGHAATYLEKMRAKGRATRANREIAALSSAFAYGMRVGILESNPAHGVKRNRETPRSRRVERAEVNRFLEVARRAGRSHYMIALIGLMTAITGRRRAEILSLTLSAVTEDGLRVTEAKAKPGEIPRAFLVGWSPLLRELLDAARALPRDDGIDSIHLFPTARGGQAYTDSGFKAIWNRCMKAYVDAGGERFTAHDLRAFYVSDMKERGEDPNTHKNPATTNRVYDRRRVVKVKPLA